MTDDGVRAAARAVRGYLPELIGPAAAEVDGQIARLLAADPGAEVDSRLRVILDQREGTSAFLEAVLDDDPFFRPPQARAGEWKAGGGWSGLPGQIGPVGAPRFRCPEGDDYDWWQLSADDPVPPCPTHHCSLVRA